MFSLNRLVFGVAVLSSCLVWNAFGAVLVEVRPASSEVTAGQGFTVDIVATIPEPVVGWGLDLRYDHAVLGTVGAPAIGPAWLAAVTLDGDGLAGLAFPAGISGTDILLATVSLSAVAPGQSDLTLSVTPDDLTEGFPLDPTGFAAMDLRSAHVTVVPEPGGALLLALVAGLTIRRRR